MNQLAPKQVDPLEQPVEDQQPVALDEPCPGIVHRLLGLARPFAGWFLPEISAQELVFKDRHHKRFVFDQGINNVTVLVEDQHSFQIASPTSIVRLRLLRFVIPLAVERVECNPVA